MRMIINEGEHVLNFSQPNKVTNFDEKSGDLNEVTDKKLLSITHLRQKLRKTSRCSAEDHQHIPNDRPYAELTVQGKFHYTRDDRRLDKEQVNKGNAIDGGNDHLMILAHSAELMLKSEDSFNSVHQNDPNHEDGRSLAKQIDGLPVSDHVRSEQNGCHQEVRAFHLSEIRRQAHLKSNSFVQQKTGEYTTGELQGRRIRLTKVRQHARSKSHSQLQESMEKYSSGNSQGITIRLSQLRRQARAKSNALVQKAMGDYVHRSSGYQTSEEDQNQRIIIEIFGEEEDSIQGDRHVIEAEGIHDNCLDGKALQSLAGDEESQCKAPTIKGRIRLSQFRHAARLGNISMLSRAKQNVSCNAMVHHGQPSHAIGCSDFHVPDQSMKEKSSC